MASTGMPRFLIGELAAQVGVDPRTIRYYESIALLPQPERSPNGYRIYSEHDITRLRFIRRAARIGLKLDEIRSILDLHDSGKPPCKCVQDVACQRVLELDRKIQEMLRIRNDVARLAESIATEPVDELASGQSYCPAIEQYDMLDA